MEKQILHRPEQLAEIPNTIATNEALIETLREESNTPPEIELPPPFGDAPRLLQSTKIQVAQRQITLANLTRDYLNASSELLPLQRDLIRRKVAALETAVTELTQHASSLRNEAIEKQADDATANQASVSEELSELAEVNLELADERKQVADDLASTRERLSKSSALLTKLEAEFATIETKLKTRAHVSEAVGGVLRTNRSKLPELRSLKHDSAQRKTRKYDVEFAQIRVDEQLDELSDLDRSVQLELEKLAETTPMNQLTDLKPEIRRLLVARVETLKGLKDDYPKLGYALAELDVEEDSLIDLTIRYAKFVDERVLWIRSSPPISLADAPDTASALTWLASPEKWIEVCVGFWNGLFTRPLANLACVTGLLLLLGYRFRFRSHINELGKQAASRTCKDFSITVEVLAYTAARAATWPLVFLWIAWNLSFLSREIDFAYPLSSSLRIVATLSYPILFWWRAVRVHGLAEDHLAWSSQKRQITERSLRLVLPVILPAIALFQFFATSGKELYDKSAGRICFVIAMVGIAWSVGNLTSPTRGVFAHYLNKHRGQWFDRLKTIWYPAIVLIPISFAVLALMGYQYTAAELLRRFYVSAAFLSGLYLLEAVGLRWLLINRRRLAIQQARERLEELRAKAEAENTSDSSTGPSELQLGAVESPQIDLSAVSMQSKRLLASFTTMTAVIGIYIIWISVLPALAKLDEYKLWRTSVEVSSFTETETGDETSVVESTVKTVKWITLGKVITALAIVVMTIVAVQNIPGLMEIALLQHLPIDASVRYAIKEVSRYLIIIVGIALAFSRIGIGWSKVQFLAAAISVGLGFGLQEIFANIMSGLILLFERPLRAGDIVTVGGVSGQVVQIRTRATTVRDWDCKELIVPNKEFITGRVLNWTLSDTVNRIVIEVGVAYGTDVNLARQILLDVAAEHPTITDEPAPSVTFETFGDSSLNFILRCYVPNLDNRLGIVHELNAAIHERLNAAGIEIPFPQRDVNVRSLPVNSQSGNSSMS